MTFYSFLKSVILLYIFFYGLSIVFFLMFSEIRRHIKILTALFLHEPFQPDIGTVLCHLVVLECSKLPVDFRIF